MNNIFWQVNPSDAAAADAVTANVAYFTTVSFNSNKTNSIPSLLAPAVRTLYAFKHVANERVMIFTDILLYP